MADLNLANDIEFREIKSHPLTSEELDSLKKKAGSYESIFSKRARKYRELELGEQELTEEGYRKYLLQDYTFLKRPIFETADEVIAGNSKKQVERMKAMT